MGAIVIRPIKRLNPLRVALTKQLLNLKNMNIFYLLDCISHTVWLSVMTRFGHLKFSKQKHHKALADRAEAIMIVHYHQFDPDFDFDHQALWEHLH